MRSRSESTSVERHDRQRKLRHDQAVEEGTIDEEEAANDHLSKTFRRSVVVGEERLHRSWPNLIATGFVGGMDVGIGVLALMVVKEATGNEMWAALAFSVGFVALTLARSELFTENFLVPITVVVTHRGEGRNLARLWGTTLVSNWMGGALFVGLIVLGLPQLHDVGIEIGRVYPELGIGVRSFTSAMLGGVLITLMTWIQRAAQAPGAEIVAAVIIGFLLAAPPLNHSIVGALEMFAGLFTGDSPYGWLHASSAASWAVLGNLAGGLGLVTVLRLVQVGSDTIEREREDESI